MALRPDDVLALLHAAGSSGGFSIRLPAVQCFGALGVGPRDVRHALLTVRGCGLAEENSQLVALLRRVPFFRSLHLDNLWWGGGDDQAGQPLLYLVAVSPTVAVLYLWR